MNWDAIKSIYKVVLVLNHKIEYLGEDKYKLIGFYPTGKKYWEREYQNGQLHGKEISWYKNGNKEWKVEYQNGLRNGKNTAWYKNGNKEWEKEYQNGELHGKSIGWDENGNKAWEEEYQIGVEIKKPWYQRLWNGELTK